MILLQNQLLHFRRLHLFIVSEAQLKVSVSCSVMRIGGARQYWSVIGWHYALYTIRFRYIGIWIFSVICSGPFMFHTASPNKHISHWWLPQYCKIISFHTITKSLVHKGWDPFSKFSSMVEYLTCIRDVTSYSEWSFTWFFWLCLEAVVIILPNTPGISIGQFKLWPYTSLMSWIYHGSNWI